MSIKISGIQLVQDALKKELEKLQGGKVALVGIHKSAGMTSDGKLTQATVGAKNHFGVPSEKIPARPWLDVGVKSGNEEYLVIVQEGIANGLTSDQILEQVGAMASGTVRQFITDLKNPPNAPYTIKKKGSDNPLIDSASMRDSVTHKVVKDIPLEGLE